MVTAHLQKKKVMLINMFRVNQFIFVPQFCENTQEIRGSRHPLRTKDICILENLLNFHLPAHHSVPQEYSQWPRYQLAYHKKPCKLGSELSESNIM